VEDRSQKKKRHISQGGECNYGKKIKKRGAKKSASKFNRLKSKKEKVEQRSTESWADEPNQYMVRIDESKFDRGGTVNQRRSPGERRNLKEKFRQAGPKKKKKKKKTPGTAPAKKGLCARWGKGGGGDGAGKGSRQQNRFPSE